MNFDIQIFSEFENPALRYTLDFVFEEVLGLKYQLTLQVDSVDSVDSSIPSINYSGQELSGLQISPSSYLRTESFFDTPSGTDKSWNELPVIFEGEGDIPFDLFSAIFFLLSRAEEYDSSFTDEHGRFLAENSWAFRNKVLERPIIDEWVETLKEALKERFGELPFKKHDYQWINTYDIDIAYAHLYRPLKRTVGGAVKSGMAGDLQSVQKRLKVLAGKEKDPFDTYDYQRDLTHDRASKNIYFILSGGDGPYDNALDLNHPGMINLIKRLKEVSEIGIHPSYESKDQIEVLRNEISHLESVLGSEIKSSRQHFLRLHLPDTYRNLISCAIENDYTMGFPHHIGFRSGTARAHKFFDLKANQATSLNIFPLQIMDGTLIDYMKLNPEEAIEKVNGVVERTKRVNGVLVTLWHNHILEEGSPWRRVYEKLAEIARVK
jgi:hypothetical protein